MGWHERATERGKGTWYIAGGNRKRAACCAGDAGIFCIRRQGRACLDRCSGNAGKASFRAARYAGMREIGNELFDLLDFAADLPEKPNMECGSRAKLLDFFAIPEGKTALEKARNNRLLFDALRNCKK